MPIYAIVGDSLCEFTGQDISKVSYPAGQQRLDLDLLSMGIEHRLRSPAREQIKSLVEHFVGRLNNIVHQAQPMTAVELDNALSRYVSVHNNLIPQSGLKNRTPVQELERWRALRPGVFDQSTHA